MWNKIKNMSLGKKIYSGFWTLWVILLAILIGLFTGLKDQIGETVKPKDGWTISENKDNWQSLIENETDNNLKKVSTDQSKYFVKDIEATNTDSNLLLMKNAIKTAIGPKWKSEYDSMDVYKIIDSIKAFTTDDKGTKDSVTIDLMYKAVYVNTKFKQLTVAKLDSDYKAIYDSTYAYTTITGARFDLEPIYLSSSNSYANTNILDIDKYNTTPTSNAKEATNATASIGFIFLGVMITAVATTVYVSIKEKKEGKK